MKAYFLGLTLGSSTLLAVACSATVGITPGDDASPPTTQPEAGLDATPPIEAGPDADDAGDHADTGSDADAGTDGDAACDPSAPPVPSFGDPTLCTSSQQSAHWGAMVQSPILLNSIRAAGIDLGGAGDSGTILTMDQAAQTNCAAQPLTGDCDNYYAAWGDGQEVTLEMSIATRRIFYLGLSLGYVGKMSFKSADQAHAYQLQVGQQIEMDGQPLSLDWTAAADGGATAFTDQVEAIYDAARATFAPSLPANAHCLATKECVIGHFTDDSGYVYFPPLGFAFRVQSITAPQPTPSVVYYVDLYAPL